MPKPLEFCILLLATYRLARLLAQDEGPAGVFAALRGRLGAFDYGPDGLPTTNVGRGISCPYCVGVYAAPVLALVWAVEPLRPLVVCLALAGGQSVLQDFSQ